MEVITTKDLEKLDSYDGVIVGFGLKQIDDGRACVLWIKRVVKGEELTTTYKIDPAELRTLVRLIEFMLG